MKTIDPFKLMVKPSLVMNLVLNNIEKNLQHHPLPWRASILPTATFGDGTWGLMGSDNVPTLICVDEEGAHLYERFVNTEFTKA